LILGLLRRHRIIADWLTLVAVLVAATAVAAHERWFWRFDFALYDMALALWERPAPADVVIVAIDDPSLAEIGRWPWRRAVHATLLERLDAAGAGAVALDLILTEPDLRDPASDAALAQAIRRSGRTVLPVLLEGGPGNTLRETLPLPALATNAAALGHISIALDGDGIARSVYLEEGLGKPRWRHIAASLLSVAEPGGAAALPGERNPAPGERPGVWVRDRWLHIAFAGPPGHFRRVSYVDVLRGGVPPETLRGKLVLVGMTATGAGDAYPTPRAAEGLPMPGVEIVANVLDGLRTGAGITTLHGRAHWALSAAPVAALLVAFLWLTPMRSLVWTGIALVLAIAAAALAARYLQVWVAPAAAVAGLALCYPLWSWRRLEATQRYIGEELARLRAEPGVLPEAAATGPYAVDALDARLQAVRAATERLRNLRQFLTDVGMSLPDALLVADNSGRVLTANARAAEYLRAQSVGALQGRSLGEELAPLRIAGERGWEAFAAAAPASVEARHPDGRDLLLNFVPCTTYDGRRIGLIVRLADITPLKQAARQREELLRFLSHDMRSPQVSILMLVALARHAKEPPPPAETLERIERYARQTLRFADDFVQLARAQTRDSGPALEPLDLATVARDAAEEAWPQARAKQMRIEHALDLDAPWVRGDRQLLARALANLLSNAIKYSPAGTAVRLGLACADGGVACTVADEGEGIPPEALPRLFEPFQRFATERHPDVDGSGLGLAFVKAAAEKHGGRVAVESVPGRGSRFTLWLPAAEVPMEASLPPAQRPSC
jgi:signal transduction histidine kinase